jgi:hypothetical protein
MALESYLTDEESAVDGYETKNWKWVVTDQRVLKYTSNDGTKEIVHDLSLDKISSVSIVRTDRDVGYIMFGGIALLIGLGLAIPGNTMLLLGTLACFGIAAVFGILFLGSDKSYFQIRGEGILGDAQDIWKMKKTANEDFGEVRDFALTVRKKVNEK